MTTRLFRPVPTASCCCCWTSWLVVQTVYQNLPPVRDTHDSNRKCIVVLFSVVRNQSQKNQFLHKQIITDDLSAAIWTVPSDMRTEQNYSSVTRAVNLQTSVLEITTNHCKVCYSHRSYVYNCRYGLSIMLDTHRDISRFTISNKVSP